VASFSPSDDPYIPLLPSDYLNLLPPAIRAAFEADEFDVTGKIAIPDVPPPIELR
jgi:nucleoporin NUP42